MNSSSEIKKTSVFANSLIWFGAAVSIAEILTGTYFAPLGFAKGLVAIIVGHIIGCALLFSAGYIGAISKKSAMETTKLSFGQLGAKFFALLNVIQLAGWTGIMIFDGSSAVNEIFSFGSTNNFSAKIWAIVIGILILIWILIGITNLGKINVVTMTLLFILTLILSKIVFFSGKVITLSANAQSTLSFGSAVELAVAMPLSWLPLISDYTKDAQKPALATGASATVYGIVSIWMYTIGMGAAIFTGEENIAVIMVKAGLGIAGLIIIILSTVTTTFLDAYSGGISAQTVFEKIKGKKAAVVVAILGTIGAVIFPMDNITEFLYLIGSVFAPMIAIQIADFFVLKNNSSLKKIDISRIIIWIVGFALYRFLMNFDLVTGNTIPDMIFTFALTVIIGKLSPIFNVKKN